MLHLCLTFDYELFFAHTDFSEQDVLFKPTERILDLLDEYDIKATFYADTASCIRYAEFGLKMCIRDRYKSRGDRRRRRRS